MGFEVWGGREGGVRLLTGSRVREFGVWGSNRSEGFEVIRKRAACTDTKGFRD